MNSITHSQRYLPHTIETRFYAVKLYRGGCSVYEEVKVIVDDWMDYFGFQEADTEKAVHLHCLPQTRYGARVAPQRCTILRIGKTTIGYHRRGSLTPQRIKIVLEKGYTS